MKKSKTRTMTVKVSMPNRVADWLENMNSSELAGGLVTWIEETLGRRLAHDVDCLLQITPQNAGDKQAVKEAEKLDKLDLPNCFTAFDVSFEDAD